MYVQSVLLGIRTLSPSFQTELVINTNAHVLFADIHRSIVRGQEGTPGRHQLVDGFLFTKKKHADRPVGSSQVSDNELDGTHNLTFS